MSASLRLPMLPSPSQLQARPPGLLTCGATCAFACATAWTLAPIPQMRLVERLQKVGFPPPCSPSYRALAFPLVGFSPTEHASLRWTHTRTGYFRLIRLTREGHLQEASISPTPRHSPWSACAFAGYLCTVSPPSPSGRCLSRDVAIPTRLQNRT